MSQLSLPFDDHGGAAPAAYRVKRATELLGRPVTENAPHLQVALLHESLREDAPVRCPGP